MRPRSTEGEGAEPRASVLAGGCRPVLCRRHQAPATSDLSAAVRISAGKWGDRAAARTEQQGQNCEALLQLRVLGRLSSQEVGAQASHRRLSTGLHEGVAGVRLTALGVPRAGSGSDVLIHVLCGSVERY